MPPKPFTPICPKCGYDQSGTIATWTTQCPLQGTCPECGYQLSWPDVVSPSRIHLPWFVEHASTKRQLLTRTLPTLWMLLIPNRYFRRVTMETPRSIKRYLLSLALLMLILHLFTTAALVAMNYDMHRSSNAVHSQTMAMVPPQEQHKYAFYIVDLTTLDYWLPTIGDALLLPIIHHNIYQEHFAQATAIIATACLGISIMWFILFCAFPTTRKRTKLRMIHITRALVVAGFLPFLLIEAARLVEAAQFLSNIRVNRFQFASNTLVLLTLVASIWMLIWTQWFWIAATRIGWQIKAKWWELILVTTASFLGLPIAGLLMLAFKPVRIAVDHFAYWIGI